MGEILGLILIIAFIGLCLGLYGFLLGGSLFAGTVGGLFVGIYKGFKNYFTELFDNLKRRTSINDEAESDYWELSENEKKKKQPARVNYFFKGGYVELGNTIKYTFYNLGDDISEAWSFLAEGFVDFWRSFFAALGSILALSFEWDEIGMSIVSICKFSFGLGKFLCILIITSSICILFSLAHIIILFAIMLIAYLFYFLWLLTDTIYCGIRHISSNCKNCQNHFSLPIYICPDCGAKHTRLRPSKYGIWKRTCLCGYKLPTTFLNGRQKLESRCPVCGFIIEDGGEHVDICIPVVGGTSSGKTCFINQAITEIGNVAATYNLDFEYSPNAMDDYKDNMHNISNGRLPEKTNDMRLKYYQFYLTPNNSKLKNLISLCDVGGEVYSDSMSLGEQIGYRYANAFLLVIDPLSIQKYRTEVSKTINPGKYGYSNDSIDEIISMLISTLENMYGIKSKDMLKTDVAIVFSKCDIPGLSDIIGDKAVNDIMTTTPGITRHEAQNIVCEKFLNDYEEINFLNSLKSKFKSIQFFFCSSLGHNADGTAFNPYGVDEPVLWLIDKISVSINLSEKWGRKI